MEFEPPYAKILKVAERAFGPRLPDMVASFGTSMTTFIKAGLPVVSEEVFKERHRICSSCPLWDAEAAIYWGRCKLCGCFQLKLHIGTEKCPKGKWGATTGQETPIHPS